MQSKKLLAPRVGLSKRIYWLAGITIVLSYFFGYRGLDFGFHWDEITMFRIVTDRIKEGVALPYWYMYPSMIYWLTYFGAKIYLGLGMDTALNMPAFNLFLRPAFLLIGGLPLIAMIAVLYRRTPKAVMERFFALLVLAGSWEYAYHLRWIAPDQLMASFGFLAAIFALYFVHSKNLVAVLVAALLGGFSTSSKYPGGMILLPLLLSSAAILPAKDPRSVWSAYRDPRVLKTMGWIFLAFWVGFLIITPGAFLQTGQFRAHIKEVATVYGDSHGPYTVPGGLRYFYHLAGYVGLSVFSHYPILSAFFGILCLIGIGNTVYRMRRGTRDEWVEGFVYLFPVYFALYWTAQRVMIVRNVLITIPFFSLLAARGLFFVLESFSPVLRASPTFKWKSLGKPAQVLLVAVSLIGLINLRWLYFASETIRNRQSEPRLLAASTLSTPVWISPGSKGEIQAGHLKVENFETTDDITKAKSLVFYDVELPHPNVLPANRTGIFSTSVNGPFEVNLDFYPTWIQLGRPFVMDHEMAAGQIDLIRALYRINGKEWPN